MSSILSSGAGGDAFADQYRKNSQSVDQKVARPPTASPTDGIKLYILYKGIELD